MLGSQAGNFRGNALSGNSIMGMLHPDIKELVRSIKFAGSTVESVDVMAINNFRIALDDCNLTSKIYRFFPLLGSNKESQKFSISGTYSINWVGTGFTNNVKGFTNNGSGSGYGLIGVNNNWANVSPFIGGAQAYLSVGVSTFGGSSVSEMPLFGLINSSPGSGFGIAVYPGLVYCDYPLDVSYSVSNSTDAARKGNYCFSRISSTQIATIFNTTLSGQPETETLRTNNYSTPPAQSGSFLDNIGIGYFRPLYSTIGCCSLTLGMTAADLTIYNKLIKQLMTDLNRG